MKRLLISMLMVANLVSGLAFAWDAHPEAMLGGNFAAVNSLDSDHSHPGGDPHHYDHCSHGAAHLMVIHSAVSIPTFDTNATSGYRVSTTDIFPSLYIAPLLRPPIV